MIATRKRKNTDYFAAFSAMASYCCEAAKSLRQTLADFDAALLPQATEELHAIEHKADDKLHELLQGLAQEFWPPLKREDIVLLAREIDEVTDCIEDVLLRVYMFNLQSIRPAALAFAGVIDQCCEALRIAVAEFHRYKESTSIHGFIVEVNRLEEEGDRLYTQAMRELYTTCDNPIEVTAWTETFDRLEKCCDACEHAANVMESVMMKNK